MNSKNAIKIANTKQDSKKIKIMKMGAPTKYKPEFCQMVDIYLEQNQDKREIQISKGNKVIGLTVKLPTVEGFSLMLGVNKVVLYTWEKKYDDFRNALDKIRVEQKQRLLNMGLSGDYNSTIAKLILSSNHGMVERQDVTTAGNEIKNYDEEQIKRAAREILGEGSKE